MHEKHRGIPTICLIHSAPMKVQSWMTIKKTEISAQHNFFEAICACILVLYLGVSIEVHQKR